jgi:RNA polymerase sigma-70 factor (ECF subfamily)
MPDFTSQPDEQLARRVQRGDPRALTELVRRHHSPLLGYLYRLTGGDRALGEDLVQETFLRLLGSLDQYQPRRRFKPWLYAIATNLARDHYKRADTRRVDAITTGTLHLPGDELPERDLLAAADSAQVSRALAALPDPQREAIILRFYQQLPLADIAETLGIPVGTVKSRLSLGLRRLKVLFDELENQ